MRLVTNTTGSGPIKVGLIHGLGANGATWKPLIDRILSDGRHTVIAVDLRGHGRSDRAASYKLDDFADDVAENLPDGLHCIIGHSLGGPVLVRAVERLAPARAIYLDPGFQLALPTTGVTGRLFWLVPPVSLGLAQLIQARRSGKGWSTDRTEHSVPARRRPTSNSTRGWRSGSSETSPSIRSPPRHRRYPPPSCSQTTPQPSSPTIWLRHSRSSAGTSAAFPAFTTTCISRTLTAPSKPSTISSDHSHGGTPGAFGRASHGSMRTQIFSRRCEEAPRGRPASLTDCGRGRRRGSGATAECDAPAASVRPCRRGSRPPHLVLGGGWHVTYEFVGCRGRSCRNRRRRRRAGPLPRVSRHRLTDRGSRFGTRRQRRSVEHPP